MIQKRYIFLYWFLLFFGVLSVVAQQNTQVKIDGLPFGANHFSVVGFKDYVSLSPEFLAEKTSAGENNIALNFSAQNPRWVRVIGPAVHKDIIAMPGQTYHLSIKTDEYGNYMEMGKEGLSVSDPNIFCDSVNLLVNNYLFTYNSRLLSGAMAKQTAQYCDSLEKVFAVQPEALFQMFLSFRLDELRLMSKAWTDQGMYNQRFAGKVFQPENPDYAYAFSEFYKGRLAQIFLKNKNQHAVELINNFKGVDTLMNLITQETFYPKNDIGEGAFILGLTELMANKKYSKDGILFLFNQIADSSKYPSVKNLAARLYKKYRNPVSGEQAPALQVEDKSGKIIDVGMDATRRTYLCFLDPKSETIYAELGAITELKKNLKDKMLVVPVIINADKSALARLQTSQKLTFDLYRNITSTALTDFRLKSDCTCMVLSPDGKYVMPNAPWPTSPDANITIPNLAQTGR